MTLSEAVVLYVSSHMTEVVIAMVVLLLFSHFSQYLKSRPKIPGPFPWPIIGNALALGKQPQLSMQAMAKRYGSIYLMKMGNADVVVLNSYKVIKDALVRQRKVFSGRPQFNSFRNISQGKGIVFNDEATQPGMWQARKNTVIRLLHKFISEQKTRNLLCSHVRTETLMMTRELIKICSNDPLRSIEPESTIQVGIANLVCAIMFGHRYEYANKEFQNLVSLNREFGKVIGAGSQIDVMPWIKVIPKFANVIKTFDFVNNRTNNWMIARSKEHRETYIYGVIRDIVDTYITESIDSPSKLLDEEVITALTTDVFGAGQDTLSTVIQWIILYLTFFTEHQQKVKKEIDVLLRGQRLPTIEDRDRLPYTEAVLHEILRHSSFTPTTIPHSTLENTTLGQYHIPKDSIVFVNQYAANHDPEAWKNPELFMPERFLKPDGSLVDKPHDHYLAFSIGMRMCPGGEISRLLLVHFIATIFSLVEFLPDPEHPVSLEGVYNLSMRPKMLRLRLRVRHPRLYKSALAHHEKLSTPVRNGAINGETSPIRVKHTGNGLSEIPLNENFSDNDVETIEQSKHIRRHKLGKKPLDDINGNKIYRIFSN